ncbi:PRC-barrel domain-containing protein [Leisingera daeponensis]|uniref:PRC-barrel domain-containing protein n=1 Tax=Leisingera daeponensis TaxID=405746 RepID=UPI001C94AED3|nr:PRC-barrel domain-containing protein [Leisingera daeponensis]MBY6057414.1 PRC-barrel domain-containing protein [Leisingera daeponensis]
MKTAQPDSQAALVASQDVTGAKVYSRNHEQVGDIGHLMIDQHSGKVAYAVMTFGGFLGMGEEEQAIPWNSLRYDAGLDGYVTDITPEQLQNAPERPRGWERDRQYETRAHDHFGVPYYW